MIEIRRARADDAAAAAACLRRSITTLCVADHRNDSQALQRWLANKTAKQAVQWIASPVHCAQVAQRDGTIVGVGLLDLPSATVALLYVDPSARFSGVSDALLRALERAACAAGLTALALTSTATAVRLYRARGYCDDGAPVPGLGGQSSQPMRKTLI